MIDEGFFAEQVDDGCLYLFILRNNTFGLAVAVIDGIPALSECLRDITLTAAYATCETNDHLITYNL